ncbi:hypothetical protein M3Y99_00301500 [Aphelenchoides fujianensis]|nr:hypothetical protein M3Y99_00301500 [Aphelenchoides fujianensis]
MAALKRARGTTNEATAPSVYQIRPADPNRAMTSDEAAALVQKLLLQKEERDPCNEFCLKGRNTVRYSPDGRYAYVIFDQNPRVCVVDLVRNSQTIFKAKASFEMEAFDFVVVNATTIIAFDLNGSLLLFRLSTKDGTFERVELERKNDPWAFFVYVITEIKGTGVELKQAVLQGARTANLRFIRVNVDQGSSKVYAELHTASPDATHKLSEDGRLLYAASTHDLRTLHTFDVQKRSWTTSKLAFDVKQLRSYPIVWSRKHAYFAAFEEEGENRGRNSVFRLDLERREWKRLPIAVDKCVLVSPITNAESGEDEGLLIPKQNCEHGATKVYRVLLKTPDSLLRLAVDALREFNLDVVGKEEFHTVMANEWGKKVLPAVYPNMKPIPRFFAEENKTLRPFIYDNMTPVRSHYH